MPSTNARHQAIPQNDPQLPTQPPPIQTSQTSSSHPRQTQRSITYRDGFSTSLCSLFSDPGRRSDCCAITCCGIFVSDRTHYLMKKKKDDDIASGENSSATTSAIPEPASWWARILIYFVLPFLVLKVSQNVMLVLLLYILLFYRASIRRQQLRQVISQYIQQQGQQQVRQHVLNQLESPHRCCPCWVSPDIIHSFSPNPNYQMTTALPQQERAEVSSLPPDLCTTLWNISRTLCCGGISTIVSCWCQCCGMCAIGQEDREMGYIHMYSPQDLQIDYITFQPYVEYYGNIRSLRDGQVLAFASHYQALSTLSQKIVWYGVPGIAFCALLQGYAKNLDIGSTIIVVTASLLQMGAVLYFAYWRWNRFDISLDAIIKYSASGAFLGFSIAMGYELLVQIFVSILMFLCVVYLLVLDPDGIDEALEKLNQGNADGDGDGPSMTDFAEFLKEYEGFADFFAALSAFLMSFVVAALVEELTKYFCFWMVEHPDFMNIRGVVEESGYGSNQLALVEEGEGADEDVNANVTRNSVVDSSSSSLGKDLDSQRAAITAAMVAAAAGFACIENIGYGLANGGGSLVDELSVLALRFLLPLHPIVAAIQSIGVIKRDIECIKSIGLGRIIWPAFLIHGTYDFILFLYGYITQIHVLEDYPDDDQAQKEYEEEIAEEQNDTLRAMLDAWPSLLIGFLIVVFSLLGYFYYARLQKERVRCLITT